MHTLIIHTLMHLTWLFEVNSFTLIKATVAKARAARACDIHTFLLRINAILVLNRQWCNDDDNVIWSNDG